jgi:hypothetical protein
MALRVGRSVPVLLAAFLVLGLLAGDAGAQEPKSVPLAKELAQLLDGAKLDAIAAKEPAQPDAYVAALYFSGAQLLVVTAKYQVPILLDQKLAKKEFREVYTDLNSAFVEGSKFFVMDIGSDGLKPKKDESRFDTCDVGTRSLVFDGEWKKHKLASEEDYLKLFNEADERYAKALVVLIAQAKKGS